LLSKRPDASMLEEAMAREICSKVQKMRKEAGLQKADEVEVGFACSSDDSPLAKLLAGHADYIAGRIGKPLVPRAKLPSLAVPLLLKQTDAGVQSIDDKGAIGVTVEAIELSLCRGCAFFHQAKMAKLCPEPTVAAGVEGYVQGKDYAALKAALAASGGKLSIQMDGQKVALKQGEHFVLSSSEAHKAGAL